MTYGTRGFNDAFTKTPKIPILSRNNPTPRIDTYFLNMHSNIGSQLPISPPRDLVLVGLPVTILKAPLPSSTLATCPVHLNLLDLITLTNIG